MIKRMLIFFFGLTLLFIPNLFAAGTVTITKEEIIIRHWPTRVILTIAWTADSSDKSVPQTVINATQYKINGQFLYSAETNPGSTAPTDDYDIAINDEDVCDIAGTLLNNRDTSNSEMVNFINASASYPMVRGNLTFVLTNNSVASATGSLILIFIENQKG